MLHHVFKSLGDTQVILEGKSSGEDRLVGCGLVLDLPLGPEIVEKVGVNVKRGQRTAGPFPVLRRVDCHLELVKCCVRDRQELGPRAGSWYGYPPDVLDDIRAANVRELGEYFDLINLLVSHHVPRGRQGEA